MTELTLEKLQPAITAILDVLGEPSTETQAQALAAFRAGDADTARRLAATHLGDNYVKSLGYLASAAKVTPTVAVVIAEAARSAAEAAKDRALLELGEAIAKAMC